MKNKFYDTYIENSPIVTQDNFDKNKINWIQKNLSFLFKNKNDICLDIGPGQGEMLMFWKKKGMHNIESVDISTSVCKHIKNIGFKCVLTEDITTFIQNNSNKYDILVMSDVLEHIENNEIYTLIDALYKSLKKGGVLIIKTPNAQSPFFAIGRYGDITHIQSFTETSLAQIFQVGNFKEFNFIDEKMIVNNYKQFIGQYLIKPIYFWWIRLMRTATGHTSPKILTQAIIAIAYKK